MCFACVRACGRAERACEGAIVPDPSGSDGDGGNKSEMESAPGGGSAKPRESDGWAGAIDSFECSSSTITLDMFRIGDAPEPASAPVINIHHT